MVRHEMTQPNIQLAQQHHMAGRLPEAEAIYRQILAEQPRHADALHLLGLLEYRKQQFDSALDLIQRAIRIEPKRADYENNLGLVLAALSRHSEAIDAYRRALALRADYPQALNNLGNSLRRAGRMAQAVASFRRAIELKPDYFEAYNNLGGALTTMGDFEGSVQVFGAALNLRPTVEMHCKLGAALRDAGRLDGALDFYQRALRLAPDDPHALRGLAETREMRDELEEAAQVYHDFLARHPRAADELEVALGNVLKKLGRVDESIAAYRRAVELNPANSVAGENLAYTTIYRSEHDPAEAFQLHLDWAQRHAEPLAGEILPYENDRNPGRRLRVGYVSPDFRRHSVAIFLERLLASHDPGQVEIFAYANVPRPDEITARFRKIAAQWRDVLGLSDAELATLIRKDQIDILVDLTGHTARNRLLAFARKPAPVQISYCGYPHSTGMSAMDYCLVDNDTHPPAMTERYYTEKLVRLPQTFLCFNPPADAPDPVPPPAGPITFGSLNILAKISSAAVDCWAKILAAVPGSRLLIKSLNGMTEEKSRQRIRERFSAAGIDPARLELKGRVFPAAAHLQTYNQIDIALDTFPYNGSTTTCEALWMGVPVITLAGATHAARVGVSLLSAVGLPELIASSAEEYVDIAASLAGDPQRLARYRKDLRNRMEKSPLTDAPRLARQIEAAYRDIWTRSM